MTIPEAKLRIENFIRFVRDDPDGLYECDINTWEKIADALSVARAKYPRKRDAIQIYFETYDGVGNGNLRELMEKETCVERMVTDLVRLKRELEQE